MLQVKNHVQTTHGKIEMVHFDAEKSPIVGKRLKIGPNQLAVVYQGSLMVS